MLYSFYTLLFSVLLSLPTFLAILISDRVMIKMGKSSKRRYINILLIQWVGAIAVSLLAYFSSFDSIGFVYYFLLTYMIIGHVIWYYEFNRAGVKR
jgi:hypothetical protein